MQKKISWRSQGGRKLGLRMLRSESGWIQFGRMEQIEGCVALVV